jgi:hypothetical protein
MMNAPTNGDMGYFCQKKKVAKGDDKNYVKDGNKGFV